MKFARPGNIIVTFVFLVVTSTTLWLGYSERISALNSQADRWTQFLVTSVVELNYKNIDHALMTMEQFFPGHYSLTSSAYHLEISFPRTTPICTFTHSIDIKKYGQNIANIKICQSWREIITASFSSPVFIAIASVLLALLSITFFGLWLVRHLSFTSVLFLLGSEDVKTKAPRFLAFFLDDQYFNEVKTEIQKQQEKISELKQREELGKIKLEIARNVAHDIRSPLSALNMLSSSMATNEEHKSIISEAILRINAIAGDLLQSTKKNYSIAKNDSMPPNIISEIEGIISEKKVTFPDFSFQLKKQLDNDRFAVHIPINEWNRVFSNILNNAVEASHDNKTIFITASTSDHSFCIRVTDFGVGIPSVILDRLGKEEVSTKELGSGIGLFETYKFVTTCCGNISIRSKEGLGTEVEITFPLVRV